MFVVWDVVELMRIGYEMILYKCNGFLCDVIGNLIVMYSEYFIFV